MNRAEASRRQLTGWVEQRRLGIPQLCGVQPAPIDGRCATQDAVVVVRVALRLHEALPTASGTTREIAEARRRAIQRLGHGLADPCHLVYCAVAEVRQQLRMSDRPTSIRETDVP